MTQYVYSVTSSQHERIAEAAARPAGPAPMTTTRSSTTRASPFPAHRQPEPSQANLPTPTVGLAVRVVASTQPG